MKQWPIHWLLMDGVLPARRYASAGTSYGRVSVCLPQVGVLLKQLNESGWFGTGASFDLSYTVL